MASKTPLRRSAHHFGIRLNDLVLVSVVAIVAAVIITFIISVSYRRPWTSVMGAESGFDSFGYNYTARIFSGPADGVDRVLDGKVWGDPFYANDHLVMKWSKAWDDARFHGAAWTPAAWTDNEWNGQVPGGSGETWHYKIVWVGPTLKNSAYWRTGGTSVWGEFEIISSQGTVNNQHIQDVLAHPAGYGMAK